MSLKETEHGVQLGAVELIWARNSKEFLFANSVVVHGSRPVIIDPSANFTYIASLASAHYINIVINTHFHGDHRSLNHLFKDVVFASHEAEAKSISDFNHYAKLALPDENSLYADWTRKVYKKYKIVDSAVSLILKDGDEIETGDETIRVVHLPGHTPGHLGLHFLKADLLFVADIDLTPYGPWYASQISDINLFKKSIQRVRELDCQYYVPSHGERVYDREKFLKKLDKFESAFFKRDERILDLLKEGPLDLDVLCSKGIVYKTPSLVDPLKCYFQYHMVKKHLVELQKSGLVHEDQGVWCLAAS